MKHIELTSNNEMEADIWYQCPGKTMIQSDMVSKTRQKFD